MPGAAVVQEHMVETNPALTDDCYVKVFTGDDELVDSDRQAVSSSDINKEFPKDQAKQLKEAIGKSLWQAVHIPTIVVRTCDGGTILQMVRHADRHVVHRRIQDGAGEAAVADLAFAAKHAVRRRDG